MSISEFIESTRFMCRRHCTIPRSGVDVCYNVSAMSQQHAGFPPPPPPPPATAALCSVLSSLHSPAMSLPPPPPHRLMPQRCRVRTLSTRSHAQTQTETRGRKLKHTHAQKGISARAQCPDIRLPAVTWPAWVLPLAHAHSHTQPLWQSHDTHTRSRSVVLACGARACAPKLMLLTWVYKGGN